MFRIFVTKISSKYKLVRNNTDRNFQMEDITYFEFDDINKVLKIDFYNHMLDHFWCVRRFHSSQLLADADTKKPVILMNNECEDYVITTRTYADNILSCIQSMDIAIISIKDLYDRSTYDRYQISFVNFTEYHYEIFNNKVSTIRDVILRLIKHLYCLQIDKATYDNIFIKNPHMKNEPVFDTYDKLRKIYNQCKDSRNKANHEGDFRIEELGELNIFESTRVFGKQSPYYEAMEVERNSAILRIRESSKLLSKMYRLRNNLLGVIFEFYEYFDKPFMEHIDLINS